MADMLAAATAGSFDFLLTGYFDRWQRNLRRTLELVEGRRGCQRVWFPRSARHGDAEEPGHNGWVGRKGERTPAPWRTIAPVSDELWERVATLRESRARHGGSRRPARIVQPRGLLYCVCGQRIRTDGTMGTPPRQRKLHP
jgi:hypothetical protein